MTCYNCFSLFSFHTATPHHWPHQLLDSILTLYILNYQWDCLTSSRRTERENQSIKDQKRNRKRGQPTKDTRRHTSKNNKVKQPHRQQLHNVPQLITQLRPLELHHHLLRGVSSHEKRQQERTAVKVQLAVSSPLTWNVNWRLPIWSHPVR